MRLTSIAILSCLWFGGGAAEARYVSPGTGISWGKANVSLQDYRSDAVACGRQAAALDVSGSDPARALVLASRLLDNPPDIEAASDAMRIASVDRNFSKVGDMLQAAVDRCLTDKGYHRFRLTDAQRKKLAKLPVGTIERHAYLHSLASNADILAHQAVN
jgi:hypothetical protein